ncbi:glycosyltransferase family 2 protein [Anaerofilum sp. BX8]|uniref:Glycosyltransferase family 2 protein n=1 Tax=Anaerofilum hominis TaxID=2763016 RepID=A0A923KXX1_9FIRM|nr:glycosyltransferase family 2 protein [Anaerofilum hominis]MBC5581184.1 glycosyltransferase family 2 protein [Anaerofilum hominis]
MIQPKLSICIAVYNQINLVKQCIESILKYQGNNIEIIVGDDCSTDNIQEMLELFSDMRIKYYRNDANLGHDMNILEMLRKCTTPYAFLLRSRDKLFGKEIPHILSYIEKYPKASYFAFSAVDELGNPVLKFSDREYAAGEDAAQAHTKIFVHPSGNLYSLKGLDFNKLQEYLSQYFQNHYAFVVHDLIRMQLIDKGTFVTSQEVVWQYTQRKLDVAVNSAPHKISVYAPQYQYPRYRCEIFFSIKELAGKSQKIVQRYLVKRFYKSISFDFFYENQDPKTRYHYNYDPIAFSKRKERKNFQQVSNKIFSAALAPSRRRELKCLMCLETILQMSWYPLKRKLIAICGSSGKMATLVKIVKDM